MRVFLSLLLITILSVVIYFPDEQHGYVTIEWFGYHIEIASMLAIIMIISVLFLSFGVFKFLFWLKDIPSLLKVYNKEKEGRSDLLLLLEGYYAIYQEDYEKMKNLLKPLNKAKNHKQMNEVSKFYNSLMAQYYEQLVLSDEQFEEKLETAYQNLLNDKQTIMSGLKGLVAIRLKKKRYHDALFYAEKALAIKYKTAWLLENLIEIYMEMQLYAKAENIIKKAASYGFIEENKKQDLLIKAFINSANYFITHAQVAEAINSLEKALKINPAHYDAVFTLARLYFQEGAKKQVIKIIEHAWKKKPNFELAKFLVNIDLSDNVAQKVKLIERLINSSSERKEGYLALAELYIEENMIPEARATMDNLLSIYAPDPHMSKLMAIIENKSQSNSSIIANWLHKL